LSITGPQGPQGLAITGPTGSQGPQGPTGATGPAGPIVSQVAAWASFDAQGGSVVFRDKFNVSSVVTSGGSYLTVNMITPLSDANYAIVCGACGGLGGSNTLPFSPNISGINGDDRPPTTTSYFYQTSIQGGNTWVKYNYTVVITN
jgi:hypothetical protein